jgi:hypothetical protein
VFIGHWALGIEHWAYLTFLRTAIYALVIGGVERKAYIQMREKQALLSGQNEILRIIHRTRQQSNTPMSEG